MNDPAHPVKPAPSAPGDRSLFRHLGGTIRGLRQKDHLTIADVAAQAGISRGMLSKIENGQAATSLDTLSRIVRDALDLGVMKSVERVELSRFSSAAASRSRP